MQSRPPHAMLFGARTGWLFLAAASTLWGAGVLALIDVVVSFNPALLVLGLLAFITGLVVALAGLGARQVLRDERARAVEADLDAELTAALAAGDCTPDTRQRCVSCSATCTLASLPRP